ncbi:hypothetical protein BDR04DRAFT_330976 [Suillus decipiens]|nr:hypothetical protein BDR04DRAFT_330976 [Suillus decipiens]
MGSWIILLSSRRARCWCRRGGDPVKGMRTCLRLKMPSTTECHLDVIKDDSGCMTERAPGVFDPPSENHSRYVICDMTMYRRQFNNTADNRRRLDKRTYRTVGENVIERGYNVRRLESHAHASHTVNEE